MLARVFHGSLAQLRSRSSQASVSAKNDVRLVAFTLEDRGQGEAGIPVVVRNENSQRMPKHVLIA